MVVSIIKGSNESYWYTNGEISKKKPDNFDSLKNELLSSNEYTDNSGANRPLLFDKMIPVIYKNNKWVYANVTEKWYDYDAKEWANAVVLNDGVNKNIGDPINVDTDVSLMFVWIPRYKYTIFNGNNESVLEQEIKINFENGTNSTGTVTCNDALNQTDSSDNLISEICTDNNNGSIINGTSTYTHPAFCFGHRTDGICDGEDLTGIWVGKFENSTTDIDCNTNQDVESCNKVLPVTIKPNVRSWRYTQVANFYTSISNISNNYGMNVDSHMMKNMEWGAVAYLSYSKYGKCIDGVCTEMAKNDSSDYYTGRSQGIIPPTISYSASGTYTYELPLGQLASTTGNIYGIYDMSGGTIELVMGNMVTSDNVPQVGYNSSYHSNFNGKWYDKTIYSGGIGFPITKYYDLYTYDDSYKTHGRGKLGDGTKEVVTNYENEYGGWYSGGMSFPEFHLAWFGRGGNSSYVDTVGMFESFGYNGSAYAFLAARTAVVSNNN